LGATAGSMVKANHGKRHGRVGGSPKLVCGLLRLAELRPGTMVEPGRREAMKPPR
jgi:hypothetical protein